jgi:hypothetical protein
MKRISQYVGYAPVLPFRGSASLFFTALSALVLGGIVLVARPACAQEDAWDEYSAEEAAAAAAAQQGDPMDNDAYYTAPVDPYASGAEDDAYPYPSGGCAGLSDSPQCLGD